MVDYGEEFVQPLLAGVLVLARHTQDLAGDLKVNGEVNL